MARKLNRLLVIDIESTCWPGDPPPGEESEIIEIGICVVNIATLTREAPQTILVRPQRSSVSSFCSELTTLTQTHVEQGVTLAEACRILRETYHAKNRLWASYGDYDRLQFERNCAAAGIPYPFGSGHLNVKTLFAITYGLRREVGMSKALQLLGLPLEGTHHRGKDDAWNIAGILCDILGRCRTS